MTERRIMPTGFFIKRYLKANNISQRDLAVASGYTEKQISLIINGEVDVSMRFASAISSCIPGLDADYILRYAKKYKEQTENDRLFLEKNEYKKISKELFFSKVFKHITSDPVEQTNIVLDSFGLSTLSDVWNFLEHDRDRHVVFSRDYSKLSDKDNVVVKLWTQAVSNQILMIEDDRFFVGCEMVRKIIIDNKDLLAVSNSEDLILNIEYICEKCGIHIAFSHAAPATYIRGLSFSKDGQIFMVLTDRFKRVENVIFAFIHEMIHIIRGDISVDNEAIRCIELDDNSEMDIDKVAANFLIPNEIYYKFITDSKNVSIGDLVNIARAAGSTIGLVVNRYHHETKDYTKFWQYLNEFKIETDVFGD